MVCWTMIRVAWFTDREEQKTKMVWDTNSKEASKKRWRIRKLEAEKKKKKWNEQLRGCTTKDL